ncbi:SsgA family sporulation/cell division regulator [Streptomyces sp. NPDC048416]|uniref:SsgA family sporulation/cell division regulator n=1 Tax=Streptomyces sp. NPDC048416 TaxID=3365546 RepID=UPI00371957E5
MSPAVEEHAEDPAARHPAEARPAEARPTEARPAEGRSAEARPAEGYARGHAGRRSVEDHARAHVVTDAPLSNPVPVALRYDPGDSSGAVCFAFPGGNEWIFPRDLLESGLRAPAKRGDVSVWPCGRAQTVLEFHSPDGVAVVQFDSSPLVRFLRHTYAIDARAAPSPVGRRP